MWRVGVPLQPHPQGFGTRIYDLNNLDREKRMDEIRYWLFWKQLRKIPADIAVEESSRVVVFRDHSVDRARRYILQVKIVAVHDLSMRDKSRVPRLSWGQTSPTRR